jgi:uncharacterized membrane protein YgcG
VTVPCAAQQRSWRIAHFQSNIAVMQDGTLIVTEHVGLVFIGNWHGIHRTIPIEYPGPHGSNYTLFLKVRSVTDENKINLKYESTLKGGFRDLKIYLPGATDTTKEVEIQYEVANGIRFFDSYDELYWNVTGNDWPVPIDYAGAFALFPANASGQLRAQGFTGVYGSHDSEVATKVDGNQVSIETSNPLPMRGGLTIDVYIPKGILKEPSSLTKLGWYLKSNPIVFLPIVAFAVMFSMWWYKGRDPDSGMSVAPMYSPPKDMSPAEAGSLIDDSVDPRDITSTIVDLAVRGYIHIEEKTEKVLFFSNTDFIFKLLKPSNEWTDLRAHERAMIENMFPGGTDVIHLSDLKNKFYLALPGVKKSILTELKQKGMYLTDPDSANAYRILAILLIAAPFVVLQVLGIAQFFLAPGVAAVAILIAVVIVILFGSLMTAKTIKGVRTVVEIKGFREFMNRVEGDRLRTMPPDTFEKFLPYAMALGVEKHWAHAFQGIIQNPPTWYAGTQPGYFNPIFFTNSMQSMTSSTYEAFTAAPRASSSGSGFSSGGGFSGGGFSGGGFGGGGGSAF